ncbi:MAG: hypothetical protein H0U35_10340 [Sporichthyaceae bacterium]|nr:hypothetical protein [Sporichthyaceae bacterium]
MLQPLSPGPRLYLGEGGHKRKIVHRGAHCLVKVTPGAHKRFEPLGVAVIPLDSIRQPPEPLQRLRPLRERLHPGGKAFIVQRRPGIFGHVRLYVHALSN